MAFLVAQRLKRLPAMRETSVQSLGREDPLEKETATHSSILAWRIPWMEKPGGPESTGSQRVGHDWATWLSLSLNFHKQGFNAVSSSTQTTTLKSDNYHSPGYTCPHHGQCSSKCLSFLKNNTLDHYTHDITLLEPSGQDVPTTLDVLVRLLHVRKWEI